MTWVDIFSITWFCVWGFILLCLLIYFLYEHIIWLKDKRKHEKWCKIMIKVYKYKIEKLLQGDNNEKI